MKRTQEDNSLNWRSQGQFNPANWIKEGNNLFSSSKSTRSVWIIKKARLKNRLSQGLVPRDLSTWSNYEGLAKSSFLLLGYSVEMFLKAGLAKIFFGCSENMFNNEIRRLSHNYKILADEVNFPATDQDDSDLELLTDIVLFSARYPIDPREQQDYLATKAQLNSIFTSNSIFTRVRKLSMRLREHVTKIDQDHTNPATFKRIKLDTDGYLSFRCGGGLPPYITYKYSSKQKENNENNEIALKKIFSEDKNYKQLIQIWETAKLRQDKTK